MPRPLYEIARDILRDPGYPRQAWRAGPYVTAMTRLSNTSDRYYEDPGDMIVRYAIDNLKYWRSPQAPALRAELKEHLA